MQDLNEVILVDKPAGMTSFGAVARVRSYFSRKLGVNPQNGRKFKVKTGHSGTLDPFATGLLIILVGKATKRQDFYMHKDKIYVATIKLGFASTTGDPEGEIIKKGADFEILREDVEMVLQKFVGKIRQTPPIYSAVKINGQKAYDLARKGQKPDMPEREVEIFALDLVDFEYPLLRIRAHVSSGTYIRTLAEDIGRALGVGAYTTELRRM
ncbi:MAG: tRNA pseudouridine(55) synthase TruB, partial [Candidatus Nomurabacteria bacterium]|nr:tRNA pseudouridine(55) synthase TruB [Candidatus Nomurabacteria bacterium]